MSPARTLLSPAGDVWAHWCVKPGEVYGAGSLGRVGLLLRARGFGSGQRPSGRLMIVEGEWCQVEVLFDRVAGLDVGKAALTVCVRTPGARGAGAARRGCSRRWSARCG